MEHITQIAYFFAFIHPSACKSDSANFALTEFSEVAQPQSNTQERTWL
jgi:hypothetical protein